MGMPTNLTRISSQDIPIYGGCFYQYPLQGTDDAHDTTNPHFTLPPLGSFGTNLVLLVFRYVAITVRLATFSETK